MKRNCNNCKALSKNSKFTYCELGFEITGNKEYGGLVINYKPIEDCPKPKTVSKYAYLIDLRMKGKLI